MEVIQLSTLALSTIPSDPRIDEPCGCRWALLKATKAKESYPVIDFLCSVVTECGKLRSCAIKSNQYAIIGRKNIIRTALEKRGVSIDG